MCRGARAATLILTLMADTVIPVFVLEPAGSLPLWKFETHARMKMF
jgi:hypothetical protein